MTRVHIQAPGVIVYKKRHIHTRIHISFFPFHKVFHFCVAFFSWYFFSSDIFFLLLIALHILHFCKGLHYLFRGRGGVNHRRSVKIYDTYNVSMLVALTTSVLMCKTVRTSPPISSPSQA